LGFSHSAQAAALIVILRLWQFAVGVVRRVGDNAFHLVLLALASRVAGGEPVAAFKVLAFYTGKEDPAHISFVREANRWFPETGRAHNFSYEATDDWSQLSGPKLAGYQVVIFLDTRPEAPAQRAAFQQYMEKGGGWLGFHFSAFALTPSEYPQNWDWYHRVFPGSDSYRSNTWRPTSAVLRVERSDHPAMRGLPRTFYSSPNEWYRWEGRLRDNPDIDVLVSIDPTSFPLGTGPKPEEIWHNGDYPVVWTNRRYRMIYINMGRNDLDYNTHPSRELSSTFSSPDQNRLIIQSLQWLGAK